MPFYSWEGYDPKQSETTWVAPNASIIGQVYLETNVNIWFGCVLRGDVGPISVGECTNIQDLSLMHTTKGKQGIRIAKNCTIGHHVVLHGCTLHNYAFVGIGATVLDGCELGEFALLAAGSLLPPNKKIPSHMLAMGVPAKVIREITPEEENMIRNTPEHYTKLKESYRSLKKLTHL